MIRYRSTIGQRSSISISFFLSLQRYTRFSSSSLYHRSTTQHISVYFRPSQTRFFPLRFYIFFFFFYHVVNKREISPSNHPPSVMGLTYFSWPVPLSSPRFHKRGKRGERRGNTTGLARRIRRKNRKKLCFAVRYEPRWTSQTTQRSFFDLWRFLRFFFESIYIWIRSNGRWWTILQDTSSLSRDHDTTRTTREENALSSRLYQASGRHRRDDNNVTIDDDDDDDRS